MDNSATGAAAASATQDPTKPASSSSTEISYALPINDDNAPDLYIPFMSLITYVLICALCYGTAGHFEPQVIVNVTIRCIVIQLMEVCLFKFGIYMMSSKDGPTSTGKESNIVSFFDLFAFTGYKYLALTCNMIIGYGISILISKTDFSGGDNASDLGMGVGDSSGSEGSLTDENAGMGNVHTNNNSEGVAIGAGGYAQKGYYIMFFWTASSFAYFMLKTMANNIEKSASQAYYDQYQQHPQGNGPKREFVILGFALSQFVTLWFLGQTKFLN